MEFNHKPLEMIHLKNLSVTPQQLQWMLLRIQRYDMKTTNRIGSMMQVVDTLSRAPSKNSKSINLDLCVNMAQF